MSATPPKVLVIDDEPPIRKLLRMGLGTQGYEILTEPGNFEAVHKQIEAKGIKADVAEITSLPLITVPLNGETEVAAVNKLIDALEESDDVKDVYSNAEFPE